MRHASSLLFATMAGVLPHVAPAGQSDSGIVVRAVRFYRADLNRTRVKGLVQIPLSMLQPSGGGSGQRSFTVGVRVSDSAGLTLYEQSWKSHASGRVQPDDAYTVEIVDFAVAPGTYHLDVSVADSTSGLGANSGVGLRALSAADGASDLLIAPEMRLATSDDTVPRPGEFRTGNNMVTAVARVELTPLRSMVYYLLEAYADSAATGTMQVAIRDSSGATSVRTPEVPVNVTKGGSILRGQLDLTGLPPGSYTMLASLRVGARAIERSAGFTMAGLGETLARDSARREAAKITDEGFFASLSPAQLDSAKAPLIYVAESGEMGGWNAGMSLDAKRRFLINFWQKRDPTPGTVRNERREQFYEAISFANRTYREGGRRATPGWRSDRGRVYAKNGEADDVYRRQQEGSAPPYEVWRYARGKGYYYIFVDRTGLGAYQLVYSSDPKEPGVPTWDLILGRRAVSDAGQFLGIDLFASIRRQDLNPRQRF
jgi:GWxTD domain-containing protein